MALISLEGILSLLGAADVFPKRNDPQYWSGWVEGDGANRKLKVVAVSLEESGFELTVQDGDEEIDLAALPAELSRTKVLVNGTVDSEAALVFKPKPSLFNLTRWAFDFRPVTLNGKELRFNLRYDP